MASLRDVDILPYEGLVFVTSQRFSGMTGVEREDLQQILRLKVAQALLSYSAARSSLPEGRYVFSCVRNKVKDLVRDEHARRRRLPCSRCGFEASCLDGCRYAPITSIEEATPQGEDGLARDRFEHRAGMSVTAEEVFGAADEGTFQLPSTLTKYEADVLLLMVLDFNQTEIAVRLSTSRKRVRATHASIQDKMRDWCPSPRPQPDRVAA